MANEITQLDTTSRSRSTHSHGKVLPDTHPLHEKKPLKKTVYRFLLKFAIPLHIHYLGA